MSTPTTEHCNICDQLISQPTDDLTINNYEAYKKDKLCPLCRNNNERINFFTEQKQQTLKKSQPKKPQITSYDPYDETQKEPTLAEQLISIATKHIEEFYTDQYDKPYIRLNKQEKENEITYTKDLSTYSHTFKNWLHYIFPVYTQKYASSDTVNTTINYLSGFCENEGEKYTLHTRVAEYNQDFWFDLSNKYNQAIRITDNNWEIISDTPILFKHYMHQKPVPLPLKPSSIEEAREWFKKLFNYVNAPDDKLIFATVIISYLIPNIQHPLLTLTGPHGSAKSSTLELIKQLIDPSHVDLLTILKDDKENIQTLNHHWICVYDNLTYLTSDNSDLFSKAVTGMGLSKRELYTNDDDVIYKIQRCIAFNGINSVIEKSDLHQRSIPIELEPYENIKSKRELIEEFEQDQQQILGAILTILVEAKRLYKTIKIENLSRMADYHKWAYAISEALNVSGEYFNKLYAETIQLTVEETINADNVALAFIVYFSKYFQTNGSNTIWEKTSTDLLKELTPVAIDMHISVNSKTEWPQSARSMGRKLKMLRPSLKNEGYEVKQGTSTSRYLTIQKIKSKRQEIKNNDLEGEVLGRLGRLGRLNDCFYLKERNENLLLNKDIGTIQGTLNNLKAQNNDPNDLNDLSVSKFDRSVETVEALGRQPCCYFCGDLVTDQYWCEGPLSFGNPSHFMCYQQEERKQQITKGKV